MGGQVGSWVGGWAGYIFIISILVIGIKSNMLANNLFMLKKQHEEREF